VIRELGVGFDHAFDLEGHDVEAALMGASGSRSMIPGAENGCVGARLASSGMPETRRPFIVPPVA
jgi:hypothetical protein